MDLGGNLGGVGGILGDVGGISRDLGGIFWGILEESCKILE